jgi:ribosomal protein S18 acetylase RimI-like enzyme
MSGTIDTGVIGPIRASHIGDLISLAEETGLSPWTANNYLDELRNPRAIMLRLASDDNTTVGFIVGRLVAGSEGPRPDAEIYNIAVWSDQQRKGHGQAMLDAFVSICRDHAVSSIWLEFDSTRKTVSSTFKRVRVFTKTRVKTAL